MEEKKKNQQQQPVTNHDSQSVRVQPRRMVKKKRRNRNRIDPQHQQQQQQQRQEKEEPKQKARIQHQRQRETEQRRHQRKIEDPTLTQPVPQRSAVVAARGLSEQEQGQRIQGRNQIWSSTAEHKTNWTITGTTFDGNYSAATINTQEIMVSSIQAGIQATL